MGNYLNKTLKQQYFSIVSSSMKQAYIENSTNKKFDCNNELMLMLSKLLVAHWYTNRNILSKSTTIENPYSVTALLRHIAISSKYEKVNENDI